jgi:hypothetical protein
MKQEKIITPVKKPKFKLGDTVNVTFIGQLYKDCTIIEIRKHPIKDRWIIKVVTQEGTKIPYVGVDGSEEHANIKTK